MNAPDDLAEVQQRLAEIQRRKRGRIRWSISRHTAEMAIDAIERFDGPGEPPRRSGKSRRRKRHKRLL